MQRMRLTAQVVPFIAIAAIVLMIAAFLPTAAFASTVPVVSGTVTSVSSGLPVEGAYVSLLFYDSGMGWSFAGDALTTADGTYSLQDQYAYGPGEYQVLVSATAYVNDDALLVWDGLVTETQDFALAGAQLIAAGTITDADTSDAIPGAQVSAEYYDGSLWLPAGYAVSESDGSYAVYDEQARGAGTYRITASSAGYTAGYEDRAWNGSTPLSVDVALEGTSRVANGTVTSSETALPLEDAYIWAEFYDPDAEEWLAADDAWTNASGQFSLFDVAGYGAGSYTFYAAAADHVIGTDTRTWNGSDPLTVNFVLDPEAPLATGSVTETETGTPISGATVQAEFYDPDLGQWWYAGQTTTIADGTYELPNTYNYGVGDYRFSAWSDGYEGTTKVVTRSSLDPVVVDLELTPTELDAYEPDDTAGTAKALALGADPQARTLFPAGDDDWASFETTSGTQYVFETTQRGPVETDTHIYVYDTDGTTLLAENDDYDTSMLSRITWTAPDDRTVYLLVQHAEDGVGTGAYGLRAFVAPPANDAPVALNDTASVDQDSVLVVPAPGVLANDSDPDSNPISAVLHTDVAHGTLSLLSDGGYTYTPDTGFTGTDTFVYRAYDGTAYSGQATVTITVQATELEVVPIQGDNRYETSVAVSEQAFPDGADWVVIATGRNWPDALGGSALAGALEGPILLTDTFTVPGSVIDEIERLGATDAIILGGTSAVGASVETQLNALLGDANVERIAGANRYGTADLVGARTISVLGTDFDGTALMATGANYPDALAAAPLSAGLNWPLFLTRPTGIAASTQAAMAGVDEVLVLGGTSAVPALIEQSLNATYGDADVTRLSGANRYATAVAVASHGVASGLGWDRLAIATGENFPDALAGGVLQGRDGSVMLLTKTAYLDANVASVLEDNKDDITEVRFFGGPAAVSQAVRDAVTNILE